MSNGLFIRAYPAVGVNVEPATYGAGRPGYFLVVLLPVLIVFMAGPSEAEMSRWLPLGLTIFAIWIAFAFAFLRSLKLEVRSDGISYASLLRKERFIRFNEFSTVVLFSGQWRSYRQQGFNFTMPGRMVITPKLETDRPTLKIPLYLFSDSARAQLTHILRPEEWDADS